MSVLLTVSFAAAATLLFQFSLLLSLLMAMLK
jgi:hypothetical protein